jgi:RimJ/RimL family protein N-acetyltransferase
MTAWLLAQPDIARVRACTAAGNMASRRVLEKTGHPLMPLGALTHDHAALAGSPAQLLV